MAPDIATLLTELQQLTTSPIASIESSREGLLQAAKQLVRRLETPAERIIRMAWNDHTLYGAVRVLIDLKIFRALADANDPIKVSELANASHADAMLLSRLLKHIAAEGFVEEVGADEYAANDMTRALASPGGEGALRDCFQLVKVVDHLPTYLKETNYANPLDNKHSPWQYAYQSDLHYFEYINTPGCEQKAEDFRQHMVFKTLGLQWFEDEKVMQGIFGSAENYTNSDVLVVDIGGAGGHVLRDFKKSHPSRPGRLLLQELPSVVATLDTASLASSGIEVMAHDMLTPQSIKEAKAYYLKMVLHDWPDGEAKQALENLKPALKEGYSRILLNEIVIPDVDAHWFATSVDMVMLTAHAAQERREWQWKDLIEGVPGLKLKKVWDVQGALEKIIEIELA